MSAKYDMHVQVNNLTRLLKAQGLELELLSNNVQAMVDLGPMVKKIPQNRFNITTLTIFV